MKILERLRLSFPFLLWGLFLGVCWFGALALPWNLGRVPSSPATTFQKIWGQKVPGSVSNLVVVKRQYLIKDWVWMRFQAPDPTIDALLHKGQRVADPNLMKWAMQGTWGIANHKYDNVDKQAVGWQQVERINKLEVYKINSFSEEDKLGWVTHVIVDREHHLVYVQAARD